MEYYHKLNTLVEKSVKLVKSGKISEGILKRNINFKNIVNDIFSY
jgi:hypothetical protein